MTSLNVRIPEPLADFITRQAVEEGFPSTDAYVLALIQAARKNAARARVEALLLERPGFGASHAHDGAGMGRDATSI